MSSTPTAAPPADNTIRTFHKHGVIEFRATILVDEKRVDVHIVDLEAVLNEARCQNHPVADAIRGLHDLLALTEKHPDTHKLEITVQDLDGEGKATQPEVKTQGASPAPATSWGEEYERVKKERLADPAHQGESVEDTHNAVVNTLLFGAPTVGRDHQR